MPNYSPIPQAPAPIGYNPPQMPPPSLPALSPEQAWIEAQVATRTKAMRTNGILLAVFLGGVGAGLVYRSRSKTVPIVLMVAALLIGPATFFIGNMAFWVVDLVLACGANATVERSRMYRAELEADIIRSRMLGQTSIAQCEGSL